MEVSSSFEICTCNKWFRNRRQRKTERRTSKEIVGYTADKEIVGYTADKEIVGYTADKEIVGYTADKE